MSDETPRIKLFALSTCGHCRNTKKWLAEHEIDCEIVDVDQLHGEEKKKCIEELRGYNPRLTFPTIVVSEDNIIVGYHPDKLEEAFLNGKEDA
jgi:glutaredoxin-like protein NrdH